MKTKISFSYTSHVVPPRCRKARAELQHDGVLVVTIPELSSEQAPIAVISRPQAGKDGFEIEYRWYAGKLWTSINLSSGNPTGVTSGKADWVHQAVPDTLDLTSSAWRVTDHSLGISYAPRDERLQVAADLRKQLKEHVLIDGRPHRVAREPRYVVMTFGLGRNHGGSAVMVTDHFNSNLPSQAYFSLLEKERALERGTAVATERGDTKSLPMTVNGRDFEVVLAEAIKVNAPTRKRIATI